MSVRPPRSGNPEDFEDVLVEILSQSAEDDIDDEYDDDDPGWDLPERWLRLAKDVALATAHRASAEPTYPHHKIGRFDAIHLRGEGGFAVVFEGFDPDLERSVALKLCEARGKMHEEARLLAKISHPNVVTVHEVGRWGDDVFFVMEYIAGGTTAHDFAQRKPPPSWREIRLSQFEDAWDDWEAVRLVAKIRHSAREGGKEGGEND